MPRTGEDTHIRGVGDKVLFSMRSLSCIPSPDLWTSQGWDHSGTLNGSLL